MWSDIASGEWLDAAIIVIVSLAVIPLLIILTWPPRDQDEPDSAAEARSRRRGS